MNACTQTKLWFADAHDNLQDVQGQLEKGNIEEQDAIQRVNNLTDNLQSTRQELQSIILKDVALKALRTEFDATIDETVQLKQQIATRDEEIASLESGTYGWERASLFLRSRYSHLLLTHLTSSLQSCSALASHIHKFGTTIGTSFGLK